MKTINLLYPVITSLLLGGLLQAQVAIDPVKNVYKIGGSSEIFISYTNKDGTHAYNGVLDVSTAFDSISSVEEPFQTMHLDPRKIASATGDFNRDGADDVVTVTANAEGKIRVIIPLIGNDLKISEIKEHDIEEQANTRIRFTAGNFDHDQQDEFAIGYDLPNGTTTIILFKTDSVLNIKQIASYKGIAFFDRNFDIAAGDVDVDGIDEIVMVKNKAMPTWQNSSKQFISTYDLYILKYDPVDGELTMRLESEKSILNQKLSGWNYFPAQGSIINEMRISCGDLNNNGRDEFVVGWSFYYCYYREEVCTGTVIFGACIGGSWKWENWFQNATFLNAFHLTPDEKIENNQNILVNIDQDYRKRGVSSDQHIAMTLKCEQMDNLGRAMILVNSPNVVHVYGQGVDANIIRTGVARTELPLRLNIQGNETFAVADLNPDTTALNFNKEVIVLGSDKTATQQLNNSYNGKASIRIAEIDEITSETITFKYYGPIEIPFNSSENIELSAFLAGDFDLSDAEVYFVGTPVVTLVKDLQQPIVILNAPPVHFDVFGGEIFDITNVFTETSNTFSAKYNSSVGDMKTTSVKVNDGMGFSSDFRAYAMAGGMGIETSIKRNWEKGRSFYSANSQDKFIDQTRTAYTEDYVLLSSMDYNYYKYPIYDRIGKKLGDIAVMNPALPDFSSAWESSANWNHPSYVFNHEPGNILSYKQRVNSADFSTTSPSDFIYFTYDKFPVTSGADHQFSFELTDISSGESSFSYAGGTGASDFVKVGIEATVEASLTPLGIGGSVASDVRIGASAEISANYHNSSLSTHTTMLTNSFKIEGTVGRLPQRFFPTAGYNITPYIYRSQSGALVLDYIVEVDMDPNGWWKTHYGENPDLAFILPWRYATEKGSDGIAISRKQKTTDIQFYPPIANPGDSVSIIARVHNFSLEDFDDLLKVDFYLGDPVDGGVKLTDIYGVTGSSEYSTMIYGDADTIQDREEYRTFIWQVPDTLSCSPRIYGVIDPENKYTEIHKNNNVGWNMLNICDCQECKYVERITGTDNIFVKQMNFKAYPNPFSSQCQITFSLPQPETVQIDLYNLAGHKVATMTNQLYGLGEHAVSVNAEKLDNGIYFCRITAGIYTEIIKLILLR